MLQWCTVLSTILVQILGNGWNVYVLSAMLMPYLSFICINIIIIPVTCRIQS